MVIDDDNGFREMVRVALTKAGYVVTEAGDGKIGLASYRQDPADLVLTDILMPNADGLETIRNLRRHDPQVKIIAMSGARTQSYLALASTFGAQRVLAKPFAFDVLLTAIREILAERVSH